MSKYKVGAYIILSRDEIYSDSDSLDNQLKLAEFYCNNNDLKIVEMCSKHRIRKNDLYNKIVDLINLKKIDNKTIDELNRDLIISYIDKIIVYEEEKVFSNTVINWLRII